MVDTTDAISDIIERKILINAPRDRVWRALTSPREFGTWFGVNLSDQIFAPGLRARGLINPDVCGHDDAWFDVTVERLEPQDIFSYRWHPFALDPAVDYSKEMPTLVTFTLKDTPDKGTLLTVVESGFDKVPPHRRLEAFRMNNRGWDYQLKKVVDYVTA
ncbi:MAG: vanillate O-demethylase oxidoreductase VanB [Gammaproteobacteria bacterium]|nr:MAG: vanillate O-demethylase oxidoreductase VanB [Gammaproteobacteria bacterium]